VSVYSGWRMTTNERIFFERKKTCFKIRQARLVLRGGCGRGGGDKLRGKGHYGGDYPYENTHIVAEGVKKVGPVFARQEKGKGSTANNNGPF